MVNEVHNCSVCGQNLENCHGDYTTCAGCGTIQLCPLPATETNAAFTGDDTAAHMATADEARTRYLIRRLNILQKPLSDITAPRLLDVGCSSGKLLSLAADRGWSVTGIEMSPHLAELARQQNPQAHILVGDVLQLDFSHVRPFDAVVALDIIEHVLDPVRFLRKLHKLLVPGGQLLLQTPNARSLRARLHGSRWNMRIPEYHFHLFTPSSIRRVLETEGFTVQSLSTASGSGMERGAGAILAAAKEKALAAFQLGNGLLVKAGKN